MANVNVFISGHRNLTENEFNKYYINKISEYIKWCTVDELFTQPKVVTFYVGDCNGCDSMAIRHLLPCLNKRVKLVICSLKDTFDGQIDYTHIHNENVTLLKEFNTHEERDMYMTNNTMFDILWIRPNEWTSGTAQNFVRRHWLKK